jgi:signal transduction histidine kinase
LKKKFGNKPGGVLQVITQFDGDYINIHVKDNGSGMSEEVKSKIFEPFYTTKDVGEGTGLGLSIAYQTILQHQGEIIINSHPDQGAEFIIKLPLVRDDVSNT